MAKRAVRLLAMFVTETSDTLAVVTKEVGVTVRFDLTTFAYNDNGFATGQQSPTSKQRKEQKDTLETIHVCSPLKKTMVPSVPRWMN